MDMSRNKLITLILTLLCIGSIGLDARRGGRGGFRGGRGVRSGRSFRGGRSYARAHGRHHRRLGHRYGRSRYWRPGRPHRYGRYKRGRHYGPWRRYYRFGYPAYYYHYPYVGIYAGLGDFDDTYDYCPYTTNCEPNADDLIEENKRLRKQVQELKETDRSELNRDLAAEKN